MSFRTIVIRNRCKLDFKANYLVYRGEEEKRIFIKEISCLILESTAISLTSCLLSELIKNNVKVIFCDEKHNPESELIPYYNNYLSSQRINKQISWTKTACNKIWVRIIKEKILNQSKLLEKLNYLRESNMLKEYSKNILDYDKTNREGHSARVYFNALFGEDFERRTNTKENSALNYGYSLILSLFNREITSKGYLTQLGIWHKNDFNYFNLSCDIMEPYRVLIDEFVKTKINLDNYKNELLDIFNIMLKVKNKQFILEDSIAIYCQSVFEALETGDEEKIYFYEF